MENIVLHLKLVRGHGGSLAFVVRHHVKVAHTLSGYYVYLNLDKKMFARAPSVHAISNFKKTWDSLERSYVHWQCGTFKIDNTWVYQLLSKIFTDINLVNVKQTKRTKDGQAVFFDIN